jgi:hypothetical protein
VEWQRFRQQGKCWWKMLLPLLCACHAVLAHLHNGANHQQGIATMIESEQLDA